MWLYVFTKKKLKKLHYFNISADSAGIGQKLKKLRIINIQKAGLLLNAVETDFSKINICLFIYLFKTGKFN